jgi:3'-5' exoribonuclease
MSETVMVRSIEIRRTRNNDRFATLRINMGQSGAFAEIDAKIWGLDSAVERGMQVPEGGDIIEISGYKAEDYQGRPQWILKNFKVLSAEEKDSAIAQFTPPSKIDLPYYKGLLEALISRVPEDRICGQILCSIFDRSEFREAFHLAPAAYVHHQNYPGGLLEHTINVTTLALSLADTYQAGNKQGLTYNGNTLPIDRDLLVSAGLLHDIGKLETYVLSPLPEVTDANHWQGHLSISYALVHHACLPFLENPPSDTTHDEVQKLLHCILSHHGVLEYGSPVEPACAEAFILSQADLIDARLADIQEAAAQAVVHNPDARWIPRHHHFRQGIFIGDWKSLNES